ncbi:MAG: choice-of-anchor J domain-containing protein [Bacteroidales bacterium]|nr:choice-of-anchor J domain-containing protein [Bacteroidales bacterium]MBR6928948.1 choice-of-anchor J domain-containing protein [Bacteroidales bacterium]MBR6929099.1 choice-of-anchor J domain-containing protein [Bacteroidales bacterium]
MKRLFTLMMTLLLVGSGFAQVLVNETFENGNTVDQTPVGWIGDGGWKAGITIPDDNVARGRKPHTGDWYMYATYNTDVWIYKEINVTAGNYYRVSFWYATWHVDHFNLEVKAGASANPSAMTETAVPMMIVDNEDFEQTSGVFQAPSSGTFYVGFHSVADNGPWYLSIDDIIIEQTAQYNFNVEQLTADTSVYFGEQANLRFRLNNTGLEADTYHFTSTGDLATEFYQNGTQVSQVNVPYNGSVELVAKATLPMNLSNNQVVHASFDVVSSHSAPTQSVDFQITAMEPYNDFPLEEGFENDFVPFGWQNNITNGIYAFDRITEGSTPSATPHDESQYMARFYTYTNPSGGSAELVSPKLELNEHDNIVRFWMFRNSNPNINKNDRINVYYNSIPRSEGGQLLGTIHRCTYKEPVIADVDDWYEYSFTFDCPDDYGFIIFEGVSDYGWNLYLDDIAIDNSSIDDNPPTVVSVAGNQTYADTEMNLTLRVHDASAMPATLAATYSIWGVTHDLTFTRAGKANYDYTATIPAYDNHTHGTMTVQLVDALGNSALSDEIPIRWDYQRPMLFETFEECSLYGLPEGWTTDGNPTWWDWSFQGTVYYTDYYENDFVVSPHRGNKQAVLEWDNSENPSAQDQTLITPVLTITRPTVLQFWTWVQYGTDGYDRFVVRVYDTYNGTWDDKWDAADMPYGQINAYDEPISIDLDEYIGKNIKIGFRGYNTFGEFLAFDWFVDDVKVIPTDTTDVNVNELTALKLNVYPNPVKDVVCIEAAQPIQNVQLMGINGVLLEDRKTNSNKVELNLEGYSKGIYVVRIVTEEGVATKKINLIE